MPHSLDVLGAWRRVQCALVLLSDSLDEGAVVAALADCKANQMLPVVLNTIKATLDLFDLGVNGQVILQDQVHGVCCDTRALSHEDALPSLVEPDVREAIRRNVEHVELLELVEGPDTNSGVRSRAQE